MISVSLERIGREKDLALSLSFPSKSMEYALMILDELEEIGVSEIYFVERAGSPAPLVLGKGYRGLVVKGRIEGRPAALKILRTDASINGLLKEAEATSLANSVAVGPKLLGYSKHVLALEFIEGSSIDSWLRDLPEEKASDLRIVLRRCFEDARRLDEIGLDHGELSDAKKHVIMRSDLKPVIIDFGKASRTRKPRNVTSLFSYLSFGPHSQKVLGMLGVRDPPLAHAKRYKRELSHSSFKDLLRAQNLFEESLS
ncbi:MAG: serine/threonine protein kinase [Thaumarchaeota archaeon]|nr:serine/threonine protein kinase [Nitrososphaerota archaeon]